jgi:hypothetical protein
MTAARDRARAPQRISPLDLCGGCGEPRAAIQFCSGSHSAKRDNIWPKSVELPHTPIVTLKRDIEGREPKEQVSEHTARKL